MKLRLQLSSYKKGGCLCRIKVTVLHGAVRFVLLPIFCSILAFFYFVLSLHLRYVYVVA